MCARGCMWATFMYCPCPWEPGVRFPALELQAVVNLLMWVLGTEPVSSPRTASALRLLSHLFSPLVILVKRVEVSKMLPSLCIFLLIDACVTQAPGNGSDGQSWRTGLECNSAVEPQSRIPEMAWGSGSGVEHLLLHKRSWVPLPAHTQKSKNIVTTQLNLPIKKCLVYLFIYLRYIIQADFNFLHSAGWPASIIIGNHRHQPLESSPAPDQPSAGVGPSAVCALHSEVTLGFSRAEPWFFRIVCFLHPCRAYHPLM